VALWFPLKSDLRVDDEHFASSTLITQSQRCVDKINSVIVTDTASRVAPY
jgi:hypothetical protein